MNDMSSNSGAGSIRKHPGFAVSIYVDPEGDIVISDLLEWVVPLAYRLNPTNRRILNIYRRMRKESRKCHITP
jgi:hypothetical protein